MQGLRSGVAYVKNGHVEIENRIVGEKGGERAAPSMSEWGVWCFPGDRAQVSVKKRNGKGEVKAL